MKRGTGEGRKQGRKEGRREGRRLCRISPINNISVRQMYAIVSHLVLVPRAAAAIGRRRVGLSLTAKHVYGFADSLRWVGRVRARRSRDDRLLNRKRGRQIRRMRNLAAETPHRIFTGAGGPGPGPGSGGRPGGPVRGAGPRAGPGAGPGGRGPVQGAGPGGRSGGPGRAGPEGRSGGRPGGPVRGAGGRAGGPGPGKEQPNSVKGAPL